MLKYLRIAVTALSVTACVLIAALWVRSYWWHDSAHFPLRSPRMLILYSYHGRLSLYAGERVPYQTGWFPTGWGLDSYSVANAAPRPNNQPPPSWNYSSGKYGRYVLFPHWLPVSITAVLAAAVVGIRPPCRFSLRTLLIATTLVALGLGLVVALS